MEFGVYLCLWDAQYVHLWFPLSKDFLDAFLQPTSEIFADRWGRKYTQRIRHWLSTRNMYHLCTTTITSMAVDVEWLLRLWMTILEFFDLRVSAKEAARRRRV